MIRINGYPIDLALSEDHAFESEVTEYPVESGADVSDNIRNRPLEITLEGVVSDTPIGAIALDPTRKLEIGAPSPSRDAYARIIDIRAAREPVILETSLGKFESMALVSLGIPRDRATGKALKFTVKFRQIEIKKNARTTVRVAVPNADGKVNGGNRQTIKGLGKDFDGTFVKSLSKQASVSSWTKNLGPLLYVSTATDRKTRGGKSDPFSGLVMNHFALKNGKKEQTADGYVRKEPDQKLAYYPLVVTVSQLKNVTSVAGGVGHSNTRSKETINGRPVHYDASDATPPDYQDGTWRDDQDNSVVKKVPPGGNRWEGVKQGTIPKKNNDQWWGED